MASQNSNFKVIRFAALVCLFCSLLVSLSAVSLRSIQNQNKLNEKRLNILVAAGLTESGKKLSNSQIDELFKNVVPIVVNLKTGELVQDSNPASYDMYKAARNPNTSEALQHDPANIKRIANNASAYLIKRDGKVESVVLPVQGYGLWSTLYGFLALDLENKDLAIKGLTFYQHAETPGLGGEVSNPVWQAKWRGKVPYDGQGLPQIALKKNVTNPEYQVDSLSGATLTSRGVENLVNFWLGEQGFKVFVEQLKSGKKYIAD